MTTLTLTPQPAGDQAGVTLTTKLDGYTIKWDAQNTGERVEIWQNTTNSRGSATKVATVADTYYDSPTLTVGTTYYIWTRRLSVYDTVGDWDLGVSAGRTVVAGGVKPANTAVGINTATSIPLTNVGGVTTPSSYNTWTETGTYIQFTAPAGTNKVAGFIIVNLTITNEVDAGSINSGYLLSRLRVRNHTDGIDVPGLTRFHTHSFLSVSDGVVTTYATPTVTHNVNINSGFGEGALIPGKVYRIHVDIQKYRVLSSLTYDINAISIITESGSADSASVA